jgi:hypothetical protein
MSRELRNRVKRLLRDTDPGDCDPCTVVLRYHYGQPEPEIPADAPRCPSCGEVHPLYEVVVTTRAEAVAFLTENGRAEASAS